MDKLKKVFEKIKNFIWIALAILVILAFLGVFDDSVAKLGDSDVLKGNDTKSTLQDNTSYIITPDSNGN